MKFPILPTILRTCAELHRISYPHALARESAKYEREAWPRAEDEARNQAAVRGITIVNDVDRKPFAEVTKPLRDELIADPALGPLIVRIESAQ